MSFRIQAPGTAVPASFRQDPLHRGCEPMGTTRDFSDLSEKELLALAISLEEEDSRIYDDFAEGLREQYPASAKLFHVMAEEENGHRPRLIELSRQRFGKHIPLIRRQDVRGFVERKPVWLTRPLGLDKVRQQAELVGDAAKGFYGRAARDSPDAAVRQLLGDLAAEERRHENLAEKLESKYVTAE